MGKMKRRDVFANRKRGVLTFGADATTVQVDAFETGMNIGQLDPYKWIILGASIGAVSYTNGLANPAIANTGFYAQLALGNQTGQVDPDDSQAISSVSFASDFDTSGANAVNLPLVFPILSPIPVFSKEITVSIRGTNSAAINSTAWYYEIWYVTAPIGQDEILEYMAAFGQV